MTNDLPGWAGSVSEDVLASLLAFQGERDWLDYKRQCDLSSTRGVVEFAKDVAAMMMTGGYIVVGADDNGRPSGEVDHLELFDPAVLHDKLAKYLPMPFEIRAATHRYQGQSYALVYVVPHADGFCIFEQDGAYAEGRRQTTIFRGGEVFARHGTKSERWRQRDIAVIKQRLQADAARGSEQRTEARDLLKAVPKQLGGSGLWLAMVVVPEYRPGEIKMISPDTAQQFLRDWQFTHAPIDSFSTGTACYRQPGSVVTTSQASMREPAYWWRLALHDAGDAVGALVLAHEVAADPLSGDTQWRGLPRSIVDAETIPARRDEVEIHLLTLLDVLTAHATNVGAGGQALIMTALVTPEKAVGTHVVLLNEVLDDSEQRQGWHLASGKAYLPLNDAVMVPVAHRVHLADMPSSAMRVRTAYRLAADLLAIFGVDQPKMLRAEGTLDPYGTGTDHDQFVYQHAQHVGLPVDSVSPIERRKRYEEELRAAKERLRQR